MCKSHCIFFLTSAALEQWFLGVFIHIYIYIVYKYQPISLKKIHMPGLSVILTPMTKKLVFSVRVDISDVLNHWAIL